MKKIDDQYLEKIKNIDFTPVFILGLHRSGTSILYKMLTETDHFHPVTAYHLIKYDQLLDDFENKKQEEEKQHVTDSFRRKGLDDRGIDKLKITADFAEEYGFFLDNKTAKMIITKKNLSTFKELCKKITYVSGNKKPILLKNPYDFSNFLYIKHAFPNAQFIFIHRHPFKILSSLITAVRVLLHKYNYYASQLSRLYNRIYENPLSLYSMKLLTTKLSFFGLMLLCINSSIGTTYYLKNIHKLPQDCYISITYENLCNNTQKTMESILTKLHITTTNKINFNSYIKTRKTILDPSVASLQRYIYTSMRKYCEEFHYTLNNYL
jgi:hypothetical protein